MKLFLTKEEYNFLYLVLDVPIGSSFFTKNPNYFFDKFGVHESQLENMEKKIEKFENNLIEDQIILDFSEDDYRELIKCFKAAKLYLDPIELPTLTGRSWEDAEKLEKKLESFLNNFQ